LTEILIYGDIRLQLDFS